MAPAAVENLVRNHSFVAPFPSRGQKTQTWPGNSLGGYMKSGRCRLHAHSKQHIHSFSANHQPGQCQKERDGLYRHLGQVEAGHMWQANSMRDLWLFGEVLCVENWTVTQYCSGHAQGDFSKGKLKDAGQGSHAQLPCQQRDKIESLVCSQ